MKTHHSTAEHFRKEEEVEVLEIKFKNFVHNDDNFLGNWIWCERRVRWASKANIQQ